MNKHCENVARYLWWKCISEKQIKDRPVSKEAPVFPAYAFGSIGSFIYRFVNARYLLTGKVELLLHLFLDGFQLNSDLPSLIWGEWCIANVSPLYVNGKVSVTSHFRPKIRRFHVPAHLVCPPVDDP